MAKSVYFVFMRVEACFDKADLALGFLDFDHSIRDYVLQQLDLYFPAEFYEKVETVGSYCYSLRGDLSALPFMEMRKQVYSLMGLSPDPDKEMEFAEKLKNASLAQIAAEAQHCFFQINRPYDYFRWKKCEQRIKLNATPDGFPGYLRFNAKGIQLYISNERFTTEASGELSILSKPLRKALGNTFYSNLVSVEIQDL